MAKGYSETFYSDRHQRTLYSATTVLSALLERIPPVKSAVDVGCGVGTWLSVLRERGAEEILGMDGKWVDRNSLVIPQDAFLPVDLDGGIKASRRFDLAISLEVAEHLPAEGAANFVASLTAMSDLVFFSAAIPSQGGRHHVNEQWQSYWVKLFHEQGYVAYDFIRPTLWNDGKVSVWYRQNALFFAKRERAAEIRAVPFDLADGKTIVDVVHPELYQFRCRQQAGVGRCFKLFLRSLKNLMSRG